MPTPDELEEFQQRLGGSVTTSKQRGQSLPDGGPPTEVAPHSPFGRSGDDAQWAMMSNATFKAVGRTCQTLPSGTYGIEIDGQTREIVFCTRRVITDELLVLPDSASTRVLQAVDTFWKAKESFKAFGQVYKRGILMWGPPGSGKTSTLMLLTSALIERNGIVVIAKNPELAVKGLEILRRVEPERPLICILEDIDEMVSQHGEHELLALLDGEFQIDNVVFVATTNYPERLDKRFINRPSRFDEIIKVGMPSFDARLVYLQARIAAEQAREWALETEGFSVAHLRELVVAVHCLGREYAETLERLKRMAYTPKSEGGHNAGFVGS